MGLFDTVLGRRKVKAPAPDRLFALTTAAIDLEASQQITTRGAAAIVFQPLATGDFQRIVGEMTEVLSGAGSELGSTIETKDDDYGYRWVIVRDDDVDDLVVGLNAAGQELSMGGYSERMLCAVFAFKDASGAPLYLIYNYKRGTWYPFVPATGEQQRNSERELQIKAATGAGLPFEPELERWFPLWGIPI